MAIRFFLGISICKETKSTCKQRGQGPGSEFTTSKPPHCHPVRWVENSNAKTT